MKRKVLAFVISILLIAQLLVPAYASETAVTDISSAYWQEGLLYTFVRCNDPDVVNQNFSLMVNNYQTSEAQPVKTSDTDAGIHYMLLIDTSTSMRSIRTRTLTFAQKLMETDHNIKITVAYFDASFSVVGANMTDWEAVKAAINGLKYRKDGSNINGSTAMAMHYLGSKGYSAGEVTSLIVVTDGEPWYSNSTSLEDQYESEANRDMAALLEAYPEIFVHTLSFKKWEEDTYEVISKGNGLHLTAVSPEEAAVSITEFTDSLYTVVFPLSGYDNHAVIGDQLMLRNGMSMASYGAVRNVDIIPQVDLELTQEDIPEESSEPIEEDPTDPEGEEVPIEPVPAPDATEATEATEAPEVTVAATDPLVEEEVSVETSSVVIYVVCAIAALILLAVLILLSVRKRNARMNAVRMRIVLHSGSNVRLKNVYYLKEEILIGTTKKCHVIVPGNSGVTSARIIKQDQMIYLEDLSNDTLLNGMRIFAPNRLRSGDEITVGEVTLRVLF